MTLSSRRAFGAGAAGVALLALAAFRAETTGGYQAPAQGSSPDHIVVGQLVDGATGRGVGSALVTISAGTLSPGLARGAATPEVLTNRVFTDETGRFMFHSLPAGSFALGATLSGYIAAQYGQTRPQGSARRLELAATPRVTNVIVKIWRYGEISGTIRDEAGDPISGARLKIIVVSGTAARPEYTARDFPVTDDRGLYRSEILLAGNYLIQMASQVGSIPVETAVAYLDAMADRTGNRVRESITASGGTLTTAGQQVGDLLIQPSTRVGVTTSVAVDARGRISVYPSTFYPGVTSAAAATIVSVPAGERKTGIDFVVKPVPAFSVSGTVTGAEGPLAHTTVKITPDGVESEMGSSAAGAEIATAVTRGDGTFTALAVPTGRYVASVTKLATAPSVDGPAPTDTRVWWARAPVVVGEGDVARVELKLVPGTTIAGRIAFESDSSGPPDPATLQRIRILLRPASMAGGDRPAAVTVATDGTFASPQLRPGRYLLTVSGLPSGWALRSQQVTGRDVTGEPIEVTESGPRDVTLTYTSKAGDLSGTVARSPNDQEAAVYLVPVDARAAGQFRASLVRRLLAGSDGTYRFDAVVPGEYLVVAIRAGADDSMEIDASDPRTSAALVRLGSRVTIGDREKRSLNLSVVSIR